MDSYMIVQSKVQTFFQICRNSSWLRLPTLLWYSSLHLYFTAFSLQNSDAFLLQKVTTQWGISYYLFYIPVSSGTNFTYSKWSYILLKSMLWRIYFVCNKNWEKKYWTINSQLMLFLKTSINTCSKVLTYVGGKMTSTSISQGT